MPKDKLTGTKLERCRIEDHFPNKNINKLRWKWNQCNLHFVQFLIIKFDVSFKHQGLFIEHRYNVAKPKFKVPYKACFTFHALISLFLSKFYCKLIRPDDWKTFQNYRIPDLEFDLLSINSDHSSSKFNTWMKKEIIKFTHTQSQNTKK